eukprot:950330-Prorocentrum_minimum.AAC.1
MMICLLNARKIKGGGALAASRRRRDPLLSMCVSGRRSKGTARPERRELTLLYHLPWDGAGSGELPLLPVHQRGAAGPLRRDGREAQLQLRGGARPLPRHA